VFTVSATFCFASTVNVEEPVEKELVSAVGVTVINPAVAQLKVKSGVAVTHAVFTAFAAVVLSRLSVS
jgi:hypothetical protein